MGSSRGGRADGRKSWPSGANPQAFRTWKRYRGGTAADIHTFDLKTLNSQNITQNNANDEFPMWHGNEIYYLSDAGREQRMNIWAYNTGTKKRRQITQFNDFDVAFPALGPEDIVLTAGGKMYLLKLSNESLSEINIQVVDDFMAAKPRVENVQRFARGYSLAPDGNRLLVEARGEIYNVAAQKGFTANLSQNSGSGERFPAWSPNGRCAAWWSDKNGEYQLVLHDLSQPNQTQTLTNFTSGFRYNLYWSPDSKKLVFVDQAMKIQVYDRDAKTTAVIDQAQDLFEGGLQGFRVSWSPDSRWVAYERGLDNSNPAIFIYDTKDKQRHQISTGFYADYHPTFDRDGKYLYFISNRNFQPAYSEFDNSFIYNKSNQIAVLTLQKTSLFSSVCPK